MHVGQTHVAAAEAVGELFVINSHQVEHRGVQVVDFGFVFDGLVSEFVGGSVDRTTANSCTRHPH